MATPFGQPTVSGDTPTAEVPLGAELPAPAGLPARRRFSWSWLRWPPVWVLAALVLLTLLAPVISSYGPQTPDPAEKLLPPSSRHWFGTDPLGMDVFTRVLYATRIDLAIAVLSVLLGIAWGLPLGALAAYSGRLIDRVLTRFAEMIQAFPQVLFAMALFAAFGSSLVNLVLIIGFLNFPVYLMMVRSVALPLRDADFVQAARILGLPRWRIVLRYVVPNVLVPVFSQFALSCAYAVQLIAGLSFIGLGVRIPTPEWGAMINQGASYIVFGEWWPSIFPGIAIVISVFALSGIGRRLRRALLREPR
jgi:peptide/nickel transport system permease protein